MGTYQSKYTGAEIDELLDTVKNGGGTSETAYSTEETKIGTWTNGKPLYQRVITLTGGQLGQMTTGTKFYPHGIADVEDIWTSDGYGVDTSEAEPVRWPLNTYARYFAITPINVAYGRSSSSATMPSTFKAVMIVKYTKTTD